MDYFWTWDIGLMILFLWNKYIKLVFLFYSPISRIVTNLIKLEVRGEKNRKKKQLFVPASFFF